MRNAIYITALAGLIAAASVQASYAQGGGGGGGGGGSSGGGSASSGGGSTGGASSGSGIGSPNAGSAGAGSLGVNGVGNAPSFNQGTTSGLANRPANSPPDGDQRNLANPQRGTNSVGTANSSGVGGGGRSSGPTRTKEDGSDAQIDAENRKTDQKVKSICKGC